MSDPRDDFDSLLASRMKRLRDRAEMMAPPPSMAARRSHALASAVAALTAVALAAGGVIGFALVGRHGPTSLPRPATSPTPTGSVTGSAVGVVISDWVTSSTYSVELVDDEGKTVASALARSWTGYALAGSSSPMPSTIPTSASSSRVYFLDGDNTVRYLLPDGTSGVAAHVPGDARTRAAISVSPDDARIAVCLFTWLDGHFHEEAYVEDLGTGGHRTSLFTVDGGAPSSPADLKMPIGWHGREIVYGLQSSWHQYNILAELPEWSGYNLIDPASPTLVTGLCVYGSGTEPLLGSEIPPATAGGVVCATPDNGAVNTKMQLRSWSNGQIADLGDGTCAAPATAAPDGEVAYMDTTNLATQPGAAQCSDNPQGLVLIARNRGTQKLTAHGTPAGWIDSGHLVIRPLGVDPYNTAPPLMVLNTSTGALTHAPIGFFVGAVPGGL